MDNSDRELLELAAKAAGFDYNPTIFNDAGLWGCFSTARSQVTHQWNPLADDGDAMRLAVKLRINIEHIQTMGRADFGINCWPVGRGDCGVSEDGDLSDYAASTRRAIVRAAAEIGKGME